MDGSILENIGVAFINIKGKEDIDKESVQQGERIDIAAVELPGHAEVDLVLPISGQISAGQDDEGVCVGGENRGSVDVSCEVLRELL